MNQKSKNTVKNRWDCVGIFTGACGCACGGSCVLLYVYVWVVYSVCVYMKVHAQRIVFTGF